MLVALFAAAWWWADSRQMVAQQVPAPASCDLARAVCHLAWPDGERVTVGLSPIPPQVMKPLSFSLAGDVAIDAAWVDVVGLNMDMGFTRTELVPAADGLWKGRLVLPLCATSVMHWEAKLFVQRKSGLTETPMRFTTGR